MTRAPSTAWPAIARGLELIGKPRLTAVFAANDQMALGIMHASYGRGVRVLDDVSVDLPPELPPSIKVR